MLAAVGALVLAVLGAVGWVSNRIAAEQMLRFLGEEDVRRATTIADRLQRLLENHYREQGSWLGVEELLVDQAPVASDAAILVLDASLRFAACTPPQLTGINGRRRTDGALHLSRRADANGGGVLELVVRDGAVALTDDHGETVGTLVVLLGLPNGDGARHLPPSIRGQVLATVATAGLLALIATWWLTGRFLSPVGELTEAAREMAAGRLDHRVKTGSNDEIGRLSSAFNAMADEIERAEILRRSMVSDVAHELRTPLTGIRCQIEALQDGLLTPNRTVFDSLHDDILALQRLVDDLQDLAIAEAGRLTLERRAVDLRHEVQAVVQAQPGGDCIAVDIDNDRIPAVRADPERLRQILRNLLDNARQHAGDGAHIRVSAEVFEVAVEVAVEDDGPGIPAEHLDLVFERFYRVEPSRKRQPGGSGLGLAITRHLVHAHGGQIRAENTPGCGGARFVFTLKRSDR